ncbi:hypothetical protein ULF88_10945 [Halopseudomonas pachastrellae]|nr:hypothetical protein [Halopseudomonas pachastrellae]WVM90229.1 hypothetical protein UMZ34_08330 [Halopseudomonas pachastrellae]
MIDDFEKNVDILLKHSFIESNNRLDYYSDEVDSIKVTNYGLYMVDELAFYFTYLDLICTDCGMYVEKTSNYLCEAARKEYGLFSKGDRLERVKVRLERAEHFIDYLCEEESRERELYSLEMPESEMFTHKIKTNFEVEKVRVLKSARKQKTKKENRTKPAPGKRVN